ncbi:ferredoxin [Amycolatopsis acidiphila]|uniref:Ferredoxin n=1 Tax=Amycolatopsis acidiphila TaxID=715473 RepID=A0A558AP10_9PSEU|nr:ferredoxin [Amycolatopsis acidiphila]TVT26010.1 ferredoxin [Amycolatopsis acidiphila]UIJ63276.1 ferredoxin [Amycolatopsis acidiphila]GHG74728.1 ferredoxin FdxD [Amycolatopsis acidiphila]
MRIIVDRDRCTGQAMCESIAADLFEVNDDGELELKASTVPDGRLGDVQEAVACCPNEALRLVP